MAHEQWHPRQQGELLADGSYRLRIPYAGHRELIRDIPKNGAHCEVLGPTELLQAVAQEVEKMSKKYV